MHPASRLVPLLLATVLVATACAPGTPAPAGGSGNPQATTGAATAGQSGTLTRAMTSEPTSLDPHGAANSGLNLVLPYLFDTLVTRQRDGKYAGLLAESWKVSADGRTVDFRIRSGMKFHDGSPLNAEAVVLTFERFKTVGSKSPVYDNIKEISRVEALDDLGVRFSFDQPSAAFFSTIVMPYAGILSPTAVKAAGDDLGSKAVGTGPFKLGEWKPGVSITLLRNPDYRWGQPEVENQGPVRFEKLVFKVVPDASTQMAALQAGEVDVIFVNEPSHAARVATDKGLQSAPAGIDALIYLGYNCAKPPFDDVRVRQAFNHAVNKTDIVKTALGGLGVEAHTPLPPSLLGYNQALQEFGQGYDPARARARLAETGFSQNADGTWQRDGRKLTGRLLTSNRAPNEAIATLLQSQFKAIGVPVEIQQLDSAAVMKSTNEGGFDLLLWRYDWRDPDALNIYLSSKRIRQTNRVFYANPKADALFEQGLREMDEGRRARIYEEAQKIILADAPWQPLYYPMEAMVYRDRVKGLKVSSLGRMLVNDVTLEGK